MPWSGKGTPTQDVHYYVTLVTWRCNAYVNGLSQITSTLRKVQNYRFWKPQESWYKVSPRFIHLHSNGSHWRVSIFISIVLEAFVTSVISMPPSFPPVKFWNGKMRFLGFIKFFSYMFLFLRRYDVSIYIHKQ